MNQSAIDTTKTTDRLYVSRLDTLTSALYNAREDVAEGIANQNTDATNEARGRFNSINSMIRSLVLNNS